MPGKSRWALLMALLFISIPGVVLSEPQFRSPNDSALKVNRRLLEDWREVDPSHVARLQQDLREFWQLPAAKREQIRKLDRQLHQLYPEDQQRLIAVMERYHTWLKRLPDEQRAQIEAASTNEARLEVIRAIREKEWIARLPKTVRERLSKLSEEEQKKEIARLRKEESDWQERWWVQFRPTRLEQLPREVQIFVRGTLMPLLSPEERRDLDQAQKLKYPAYLRTLYHLAGKTRIPLPGPVPPAYVKDLPTRLQKMLRMRKKELLKELTSLEGQWPQFALALKRELPMPSLVVLQRRHMPSRLKELSKNAQKFVTNVMMLRATEKQKDAIAKAEGQWPRYPLTLQRVARELGHRGLPGTYLPGPGELWKQIKDSPREKPKKES